MVGALAGVGGMAFLFSEMLKYQAEDQVRSTLDGKVNAIASVTKAAETLAYGLGVSAITLHERQAQYADTYRELTLQLFERRPEFIVGLGLGQQENGLIDDQSWLFPYYWVDFSDESESAGDLQIRYEDLADDEGEFYPTSEQYREFFLSQENAWAEPRERGNSQLLTYYFQLLSADGERLGTTLVDVDGGYISQLLDSPVFRGRGNFLLVTRSGEIVADPANPANNLKTYEEIADLSGIWDSLDLKDTGFLEGETGYWAYAIVPGQDWFVFGFVPYAAIFNRLAGITVAATALMVALLSIAILLAIRGLNRRLRPVLNQCNHLAQTDPGLLAKWDQEDDLNQLSLAFFNMLEQLNLNEETIRRHEQKIEKETLHAGQVSEQLTTFASVLERQGREQQALIQEVQKLVASAVSDSQSVDIQLDALNTLGRALSTELSRPMAAGQMGEMLSSLEEQLESLNTLLEAGATLPSSEQLRTLIRQLLTTAMGLKAREQQRPSADSLWQQTRSIAQTGQVAAVDARSAATSIQSVDELLAKIEKISETIVRRAKSVMD